jgi:hypothetical protein
MRIGTQIALITAVFGALYAGLRYIPASNCNFLHYEETVVTADGLQFCGSGTAYFVDLEKLPFPVKVNLTADHAPAIGVESHYTLTLAKSDGSPFRPSELAVSQTRRLHLLLVDANLEDYQHIHPEPVGDSGDWTFSYTPHDAGHYHVYAQFIPSLSMREMIGQTEIVVPGDTSGPVVHRGLAPFKDDGYVYTLTPSASPVIAGSDTTYTFAVSRAGGGKVDLQEIMGTLAHLVAFDPSRDGVAHLHPTLTGHERDATHPQLSFLINLTQPGQYRLWAQVKIDNRERYVPFDVEVKS